MRAHVMIAGLVISCGGTSERTGTAVQAICTGEGQGGECCPGSPIIIDMAGDGLRLTSADDGVVFALHPGRMGHWAWTALGSDDAFLALDRDGDGAIHDGGELFGDGAAQIATPEGPNGFAALAYYDLIDQGGNADGVIDERDTVWPRLLLWRDADHDGLSPPDELSPVMLSGIHAISVNAIPSSHIDEYGNEIRFVSALVADAPIGRVASDVWLLQDPIPVELTKLETLTNLVYHCVAWFYVTDRQNIIRECSTPAVASDPIITLGAGASRTRRVSREATTVNDYGAARVEAESKALTAISGCRVEFPYTFDHDPFKRLPYDSQGSSTTPRVKCESSTIGPPGGGGCGG